jgi:hypothetical protein
MHHDALLRNRRRDFGLLGVLTIPTSVSTVSTVNTAWTAASRQSAKESTVAIVDTVIPRPALAYYGRRIPQGGNLRARRVDMQEIFCTQRALNRRRKCEAEEPAQARGGGGDVYLEKPPPKTLGGSILGDEGLASVIRPVCAFATVVPKAQGIGGQLSRQRVREDRPLPSGFRFTILKGDERDVASGVGWLEQNEEELIDRVAKITPTCMAMRTTMAAATLIEDQAQGQKKKMKILKVPQDDLVPQLADCVRDAVAKDRLDDLVNLHKRLSNDRFAGLFSGLPRPPVPLP